MIKHSKLLAGAMALSLVVSSAASAAPAVQPWVADAFDNPSASVVERLSDSEMAATQGRFAPLAFIGVVVGADLALASFFWGVYLPTVYGRTGGGACSTCSILPQHR